MSACAIVAAGGVVTVAAVYTHNKVMTAPKDARQPWPKIVALELAGNGQVMAGLLDRLEARGIARVRKALLIDGLIIIGYVTLFGTWCLLSREAIRDASSGTLESVGVTIATVMAAAALCAGLLDIVEDVALWSVLGHYQVQSVSTDPNETEAAQRAVVRRDGIAAIDGPSKVAGAAATGKFLLLAGAALWLFAVLVIILTRALA